MGWAIAGYLTAAAIGALVLGVSQRAFARPAPRGEANTSDRNFFLEHPNFFRSMALLGILVALVFVALPFYHAGDKDSSASIDAAAAQALGAVVAAMALLMAVWAVNVTDKIARKIETSGMNDDTIAANSKLHDQWQTINLEFIRNDKLRLSWEPEVEGDSEVPGFETRLAFTFYIMQILRLTMLYEKNHIDVSLEDASKLYWAHWLTRGNERVWNWICERGRGFSKDDLAKITRWSEEYARLPADATPSDGESPRS